MDIQGSLFQTVTDDMQYMFGLGVSSVIWYLKVSEFMFGCILRSSLYH
jgi:hypothetical protein